MFALCRMLFVCLDAVHISYRANRPGLADFGWFSCCPMLERIGFLQGSEALPAHGTVGLQGH